MWPDPAAAVQHRHDRSRLVDPLAAPITERILSTPSVWAVSNGQYIRPMEGAMQDSPSAAMPAIATLSHTIHHPRNALRMGLDTVPVGGELRICGVQGLRLAAAAAHPPILVEPGVSTERISMVRSESSVEVDHSADEVFAFLADGTNNPKWRSGVNEIRHIRGRGVGAEYEQLLTGPGGRTMRANYRVVASDQPTRLEFEVTAGPARPRGSFTITAISPTSCRVTFAITLELQGVMRFVQGMIEAQVAAEAASIHNLPRAMREP